MKNAHLYILNQRGAHIGYNLSLFPYDGSITDHWSIQLLVEQSHRYGSVGKFTENWIMNTNGGKIFVDKTKI